MRVFFSRSGFGALEWTLDWVAMSNSPLPGTCVDGFVGDAAPHDALRAKRGAHFASDASTLTPTTVWEDDPTRRTVINGMRCGRTP